MADEFDLEEPSLELDADDKQAMRQQGGQYAAKGAGAGLATGAAIGTAVGPIGTIVGGAIGAGVGALTGFFTGKKQARNEIEAMKKAEMDEWKMARDANLSSQIFEGQRQLQEKRAAQPTARYDDIGVIMSADGGQSSGTGYDKWHKDLYGMEDDS